MKTIQQLNLDGLRVLDGGMATELEAKGCDLSGPLWSAQVLETSPETVAAVHREYLEAGADCLYTASYQVSFEGFAEAGRASAAAADALRTAVQLAARVRKEYVAAHDRKIWIAASLGPYGAALHNGAEYHGNYGCEYADLVGFHRRRLAVLAETDADFVAFETIPSQEEAQAIVEALAQYPSLPACLSFTCPDDIHIGHGERLCDCARMLDRAPQLVAVGVNCTQPKLILNLIGEIAQATIKPIFISPNSGECWDAATRSWQGKADLAEYTRRAKAWYAAGAHAIGGCCRATPAHIRGVREAWESCRRAGPPAGAQAEFYASGTK